MGMNSTSETLADRIEHLLHCLRALDKSIESACDIYLQRHLEALAEETMDAFYHARAERDAMIHARRQESAVTA